ncbi:IclR family transcriptional regulator [Aquabacter sp. L1I39]|uniref:IclR family transcriptional regulator n=1 Tax=Aquabacter sp. L1I39 TaxID=2820278 RepID=UPI001AD9C348|nr:IclR family transcriptional regulator [Aquabacter sp. L1I39]QTL04088.1 IclR family transcriptional regulator [Aquabacter sp. L1I39]
MAAGDGEAGGTQSIRRAASVLRVLAQRSQSGARMVDITRETGLIHATAHRIVQGLIGEGLARQNPATRRYHLGAWVYELGLLAEPRLALSDMAGAAVERLAEKTGDTVFAAVRAGGDALCIKRAAGSFPIKAFTIDVGARIPLGIGCGGLAMLAALPEEEANAIMASNGPRLPQFGDLGVEAMARLVAEARARGYATNLSRAPGVVAVGVAVLNPDGGLAGSLSVAAIESRLSPDRVDQVARLLRAEARRIEKAGEVGVG